MRRWGDRTQNENRTAATYLNVVLVYKTVTNRYTANIF